MSDGLSNAPVLQVSHIWRDEVMANKLFDEDGPVTLGTTDDATFVMPDMGLPADFAIFRPGARGYVMTLGAGMKGDLQLSQKKQKVSDFVGGKSSDMAEPGGFRGAAIVPGDFGIIKLSGEHEHSLFFQFVNPAPILPKGKVVRDAELLLPAFAFAFVLVGFFLIYALAFYDYAGNGFLWPGRRELVANYLINRPPPLVEEEEEPMAAVEDGEEKAKPTSTAGKEAKSGGEGEKERKRAEDPDKGEPDEALPTEIQVGLLSKKSRKTFDKIRNRGGFDEKLGKALARMQGPANDGSAMGYGDGKGTGVGLGEGTGTLTKGTGKGTGGGGNAHADVTTQRAIKTGGKRPPKGVGGTGVKEVKVKMKTGKPSGSFGGLTHEQIMKVVRTRARAIQACYSRELQRNKGLGGKVIVKWKIDSGGKVSRTKVASTTMKNGRVEDCVVRQVNSMKFPSPKGGGTATVNFPFIFGQQ